MQLQIWLDFFTFYSYPCLTNVISWIPSFLLLDGKVDWIMGVGFKSVTLAVDITLPIYTFIKSSN